MENDLYNRQRDIDCGRTPRTIFDLPKEEIFLFVNEDTGFYEYEFIDNTAFDLSVLNNGHGKVFSTNVERDVDLLEVTEWLLQHHPEADIDFYYTKKDWEQDVRQGF